MYTGEKPYPCSICTRSFSVKSHVARHERTHTKDRLAMAVPLNPKGCQCYQRIAETDLGPALSYSTPTPPSMHSR